MSRSIPVNKKSRGRPKTGIGPVVGVRLYPEMEGHLDAWIERQDDAPSRPEAIRRLVQIGLDAESPAAKPRRPAKRKEGND